jgi:hypothetical protein
MPSILSGSLTCAAGQAAHPCATFVRRLGPLGSDKGLYVAYAPSAPTRYVRKALGLTIPHSLLVRVDELIE